MSGNAQFPPRRLDRRALLRAPIALAAAPAIRAAPVRAADLPQPRVDPPDSPVGERLRWVLDAVNGGADRLDERAVADQFAPAYLEALPAAELLATFRRLAPAAPFQPARWEGPVTPTTATVVATSSWPDDWRVSIGVEPEPPHRIVDLFLTTVPYPAPLERPPADWGAFDRRLRPLAPQVGFLAAELAGGRTETVHALGADRPLAVGSSFKLYVLGELARQVGRGEATWDEPLAIRDDLRSLPAGDLRLEPAGATYPLRAYADAMISASDNTATDHLLARLGRERVEGAFAAMGHHDPALNRPLLATREWFAFKLRLDAAEVAAYLAGDDAARRRVLQEEIGPLAGTLVEGEDGDWITPRYIDRIEWFATPADLCRALAALHLLSRRPALAPVRDALSIEPGIAFDARAWAYVGYKAGYETGVRNASWLLGRSDGRWFALSATINDPRAEIDGPTLSRLMVPAAALLARTP